jgi:type II pantothenate kinase
MTAAGQRMFKDVIVAIDRGASFTDFGVVADGRLVEAESIEGRGWEQIGPVLERLCAAHRARQVVFTGSAAGMPADLKKRAAVVAEIDAVGFGGAALAGLSECVVVSAGTGTAVVHFKANAARHVGGTGVGGGTLKGLGALLCGVEDPRRLEMLASNGSAAALNLTLADLGYEGLSFLGADVTASNFAAPKSRRPEDLAAAVLALVAETIGIVASLCARELDCRQHIVMVGKVSGNGHVRHVLELVGKLYQTRFLFPEDPGYATVFGAAVKHMQDR